MPLAQLYGYICQYSGWCGEGYLEAAKPHGGMVHFSVESATKPEKAGVETHVYNGPAMAIWSFTFLSSAVQFPDISRSVSLAIV
jgi:hypothetical protein